jgi:lipopolysaccharide export system permease protein
LGFAVGGGARLTGALMRLDRYILVEWLKILGLAVGATFGVLVLAEFYDSVLVLLSEHAPAGRIALYYVVLAPSYLSLVLPISILISLLYVLGHLHRNNEIVAMRAAGIGLFRITRWILITATAFSGLLFYFNGSLIPWSVEHARLIRENLKFAHEAKAAGEETESVGLVYNVGYDNRADGRRWMIARYSEYSNRAFGIQVSELDAHHRETRRVVAAEGFWDEVTHTWEFLRGREMHFNPETDEIVRPLSFDRRVFKEFDDDPAWMQMLDKDPTDLSFFELGQIITAPEVAGSPRLPAYAVRYHELLAGTFSCLIAAGLAIPFAVFYVLSFIGRQLGEQSTVGPALAAWLPNIFMAGLALFFLFRAR